MNKQETSAILAMCTVYWPNFAKGTDPTVLVNAWAAALSELPYASAKQAVPVLARSCKFPPTVAELVEAADPFTMTESRNMMDILWYRTSAELGLMPADFCEERIAILSGKAPALPDAEKRDNDDIFENGF